MSHLSKHESQVEITISDIIEISNLDAREFLQTLLLKRFEGMALNDHGNLSNRLRLKTYYSGRMKVSSFSTYIV